MNSRRKLLLLVMFPALALLAAGCGGINTSQTISPATFFLPGLLRADPPKPAVEPGSLAFAEPTASETQVALAR